MLPKPILAAWDLGSFLQNATTAVKTWGGYFIILVGVIMIIASVYQIARGLMSRGPQGQTNWIVAILLLLLGGAFSVGGYEFVSSIAAGGKATIEALGNGTGGIILLPGLF